MTFDPISASVLLGIKNRILAWSSNDKIDRKGYTRKCYSVGRAKTIIIESVDSIIESVDSISRDERDAPLTQYITNAGITRAR